VFGTAALLEKLRQRGTLTWKLHCIASLFSR